MNYFKKNILTLFLVCAVTLTVKAQVHEKSWRKITNMDEGSWFANQEAKDIAENVLLYQRNIGGWQKNIQMQKPLSIEEKKALINLKNSTKGCTTDNGATYQEMLFLSKIYRQVPDERYKKAFLAGLNYILEAQYDNGGWPQYYPLRKGYYTHITYNDDSMVNILNVLKEIKDTTDYFSIKPSKNIINKSKIAFKKGIDCIIKTQYKQHGVLTSWCAQHDENTMLPTKARAYELPSLSGQESAGIVLLLMDIENPSTDIINSINSACIWFEKVKLKGIKQERIYNEAGKTISRTIIQDEKAPPLWARFMDLENNTPFFCDRDGIKKATLAEIGEERRNGYGWYTNQPSKVLEKYPEWKLKYDSVLSKKKE
ncbi:pectate lyase [Algibacter amylolyticus]|uniref:Pectate lyase n=1 Tax=Algibacter amylolyticus TaxID=1608400 RepID=A0A5M7BMQ5_9FLAO|nr:pectate lyase [Algibacter amylolyticus]KAA5827975.1 pectate lyase [Algibacter amylolyticus]MBB5267213.1 pectinesterase [Algibacter amylolyticus]TSJ82220.1 pectate lyase [Algibacter amylolyticus]